VVRGNRVNTVSSAISQSHQTSLSVQRLLRSQDDFPSVVMLACCLVAEVAKKSAFGGRPECGDIAMCSDSLA